MIKTKSRYQGKPRVPRWLLLTAIVVFHLAVLYGLSRLLAPEFTASVEEEVAAVLTVTVTAPQEPETPPEPDEGALGDPGEDAVPEPVTAPIAKIPIKPEELPVASSTGDETQAGATDAGDGTGNQGEGLGTGSGNSGNGQGNGIAKRPSVLSGRLDPRRDFPVPEGGRSTRFGTSVTVVFTITPEGRAINCSVARSTSDAATTALVCGLVSEKIRFNPARTADGQAIGSRYGYRVDFRAR